MICNLPLLQLLVFNIESKSSKINIQVYYSIIIDISVVVCPLLYDLVECIKYRKREKDRERDSVTHTEWERAREPEAHTQSERVREREESERDRKIYIIYIYNI